VTRTDFIQQAALTLYVTRLGYEKQSSKYSPGGAQVRVGAVGHAKAAYAEAVVLADAMSPAAVTVRADAGPAFTCDGTCAGDDLGDCSHPMVARTTLEADPYCGAV
jgi:hypothetical protein